MRLGLSLASTRIDAVLGGGLGLLRGEEQGFAIDATMPSGVGSLAIADTTTAANNRSNISLYDSTSPLTNAGTSPKLVDKSDGTLEWSPHNLFINSATPATQNVTLITGATYTVTVTGAGGGDITGSVGASGTATTGSPATFVATGTSGTFTLTGSLDTIQINRGSVATAHLVTGAAAVIGVPVSYDIANSQYGILSEPAATNLQVYSQEFDNAAWTKLNAAVAANAVVAPDGTTTADTLTDDATNAAHAVYDQITLAINTTATLSVYAKAGTNSFVSINMQGTINRFASAVFDLSNTSATEASETNTGVSSGTIASTKQEYLGGGIFRLSIAAQTDTANPQFMLQFASAATGNTFNSYGQVTYSGTGTTLYLWGAQAETGTVATSYIPTYAATATRAADDLKVLTSAFPYSAAAGTFIIEMTPVALATNARFFAFDNSGTANYANMIMLWSDGAGNVSYALSDSTVNQVSETWLTELSNGTTSKFAAAWEANNFAAVFDGGTPKTDNSGSVPTGINQLFLAVYKDSTRANVRISKVTYLPRRMTDAELIAETS